MSTACFLDEAERWIDCGTFVNLLGAVEAVKENAMRQTNKDRPIDRLVGRHTTKGQTDKAETTGTD